MVFLDSSKQKNIQSAIATLQSTAVTSSSSPLIKIHHRLPLDQKSAHSRSKQFKTRVEITGEKYFPFKRCFTNTQNVARSAKMVSKKQALG